METRANPSILVILGSTRQGRNGGKVADWLMGVAGERFDAEYQLADLRDWNLPYYDSAVPPAFATPEGRQKEWADLVDSADGFVVVTPEYNHGYPAVLKTHLDAIYRPWNRKPVAFVSYGAAGAGYRAVEQLRQVAVELQMVPIRDQLGIPLVWEAFDENGGPRNGETLAGFAHKMLNDLEWWAVALRRAREADVSSGTE